MHRLIAASAVHGTGAPAWPTAGSRIIPVLLIAHDLDEAARLRSGMERMSGDGEEGSAFRCVGHAREAEESLRLAAQHRPEIVLLVLDAAGRCIPELISLIREQVPGAAVLVLAQDDEPELVCRSLRSGADGYVVKDDQTRPLHELLRAVWSGHLPVSPGVARLILTQFRRGQPRKSLYDLNLSPRQREVLDQICRGWTNKEIAAELGISTDAVKLHVKAVKRKMGVHSRTQISGWGGGGMMRVSGQWDGPRSGMDDRCLPFWGYGLVEPNHSEFRY